MAERNDGTGRALPPRLGEASLRDRTAVAVADPVLRARTARAVDRFAHHRVESLAGVADPEALRAAARAVKASVLADLPGLLERFADKVLARGGHVHWAPDAATARRQIGALAAGARVVKSKSMATEEIGLTEALEADGSRVVETDLGEWVVQLAGEPPSHIIAPALHHDRHTISELFAREAREAGITPATVEAEPAALAAHARARLREEFLAAEVGITGANFGVAETGSIVLVTNEGNGRLVTSLPPVHVVVMGMERLVADWHQLDLLLALLTRSATGQSLTSYVSITGGPRPATEEAGPAELHVVILDNGRSALLGSEMHEMLACIRCGACLNVCPVFRQVGGHAYGSTYPGPMGAVLTPLLEASTPGAAALSDASTLCGACVDACPVGIPLTDLLLSLRRRKAAGAPATARAAWRAWAAAWSHPAGYRASTAAAATGRGATRLAGLVPPGSRWAQGRTLPTPAARTFHQRWRAGEV